MKSIEYKKIEKIAEEIGQSFLATDLRFNGDVFLIHEEGTVLFYRRAFMEEKDNWYLIFTEHHGTIIYPCDDIDYIGSCTRYER